MATPPTSNSGAGNNVRNAQRVGIGGAMTQNPQNVAPAVNTPTLNAVAGAFGPAAGLAANLVSSVSSTTPPPMPTAALSANGTTAPEVDPLVNELMKYPTYTYALSFEAAPPSKVNKMFATETYEPADWTSLIKTGGLGTEKPKGANGKTYFNRDFYIDNLRLKTIVGMTPVSRVTNVVSVAFTVTEPYGVSLIEELFDFATEGMGQKNYLEMCFLLKIDFIAYDDSGHSFVLDHHRKYIPIRLINITFSITAAGAVYEVEAIPFSHMALSDKLGFVPKDTQLEGTTLNELTSDTLPKGFASSLIENQKAQIKSKLIDMVDVYKVEFVNTKIGDSGEVINIGTFPIATSKEIQPKETPMAGTGPVETRQTDFIKGRLKSYQAAQLLGTPAEPAAKGINILPIKNGVQTVVLNGGSSIIDSLENLIKGSTYITDQMVEYSKRVVELFGADGSKKPTEEEIAAKLNYPIKWFKIIPSIKFLDDAANFDAKRNCYPKEITYKVVPYLVYSNKLSIAPSQIPKNNRVVKNYNYIYTGKNTEILNFDIKFDLSFFHLVQFNSNTQAIGDSKDSPSSESSSLVAPPASTGTSTPMSCSYSQVTVSNSTSPSIGPGTESKERAQAADVASSLYNPGDLTVIELDILGDPDYIKQDDIFYKPMIAPNNDPYNSDAIINGEANGSKPKAFGFDSGEIYFRFTFFTPTDYNLDSGLMEINRDADSKELKRSMFSGLYRIVSAESVFSGGTFKQKLEAFRLAEELMAKKK